MAKKKKSNTPNASEKGLVMQNVTVQPFHRQSQDVGGWRRATRSAESLIPRRNLLYDLYHDIFTTDAQVIAVWGKRQDAITTAKWEFTDKQGNPVDAINELIDCVGFEDLLKEIIDSKAWGYSMGEARFFVNQNGMNEFSVYSVPKKHMRPEKGVVLKNEHDEDGLDVNSGVFSKTVMQFGKSNDLGLLLSAAMYAIYKRGSTADWAEFIEIFGRGIIDAEWDGFDETQRQKLSLAIQEMGSGGVIIRPSGTKIDIKNNTGNADGKLQDAFVSKMDAYISKVLLGSTETTDSSQSSGYAQAEIHNKQDEKKNEADLNFVRRSLNSQFIKVLKAAGFDTKGGTFVIKKDKNLDKTAFDIHKTMKMDLKVPIDDDFFYEEYGVRKPDNYAELKKELLEPKKNGFGDNNPDDSDDKNASTPQSSSKEKDNNPTNSGSGKDTQLSFLRRLLRLFHVAPTTAITATVGAKPTCCGVHHTNNIHLAAFVAKKEWDEVKPDIIQKAWEAKGDLQFLPQLFNYTAGALTSAFVNGWHSVPTQLVNIGFEYGVDDPASLTAFEMNLFRFASVKTLYEANLLNDFFREKGVDSFKEFKEKVEKILDIHNTTWLETEYNAALSTGEMAALQSRLLKQTDVFPFWEYKTVGDDKVRHAHALLDGVVLPWNDPAWDHIFPPNDWNCRCRVLPRTKAEVSNEQLTSSKEKVASYLNSDAFKKSAKSGWGVNRAAKKMVFAANQQYAKNYLDAVKNLDKLNFANWDLKAPQHYYNDLDFIPKFDVSQKQEAIEDFLSNIKKITSKKYGINDYNNRTIVIDKSTIRKHTTDRIDKYKNRHTYLNELQNVILQPDEVWLQNYKNETFNAYIYIKYYKGKSIAVVCTLSNDLDLNIETWFDLENNIKIENRHGLLIYKKSR